MNCREQPIRLADPAILDKRLAIIVPYRDRASHLQQFVPHIKTYFERDKVDSQIAMSLHVVEQLGDAPFNRGLLRNAGARLAWESTDYFCFHDVDYLPVWADYSFCQAPTRAIWHGLRLVEIREHFFGGVVLLSKEHLQLTNGYPNTYWGWGFEDTELLARCRACGLDIVHRDGTFIGLPHEHAGKSGAGETKPEVLRNRDRFGERASRIAEVLREDGLTTAHFTVEDRSALKVDGRAVPDFNHYRVRLEPEA